MAYFDKFDIVQAHFWWNTLHHKGQFSGEYTKQCRILRYYKPGACENAPDSENARDIYLTLCEKAGGTCDCTTNPPWEEP